MAVWIVSIWNHKATLWLKGRRRWREKLLPVFAREDRIIWFHCASLGEFEQGRPIIEAIRHRMPDHRILLTFFSPSGYEKRKDYAGADHVMYLPLDTKRNASYLLDSLSLEMAVFIKYEFWYHFLNQLDKKGVPTYLASGNFRPDQIFFRWYGTWYRKFLDHFTHIFVQKNPSMELLEGIGRNRVSIAGDTRFDRVKRVAETPYENRALESFADNNQVIVAGSTWEKDEIALERAMNLLPDHLRWIIAPHELSPAHIQRLVKRFPLCIKFTELGETVPPDKRVIIVDTIGQLSYLYRYGSLAYIGGGFGKGIHNILEAATFGIPVIFGPRYHKFSEAVELAEIGGAFPVLGEEELLSTIRQQLENPDLLKTSSQIAGNYVTERVGATSVILDRVCKK